MKKLVLICLVAGLVFWGTSAWAVFYSEIVAYPGPPNYEDLSDYGAGPTQIIHVDSDKNLLLNAGWWNANARIATFWDQNFQGWINTWTWIYKDFEVIAPGAAAISFSFNGSLQVSGSTAQSGDYYSDVVAVVTDDTPIQDNYEYWYETLDGPGRIDISQTKIFNYLFEESDVGDIIEIGIELYFEIIPNADLLLRQRNTGQLPLSFAQGESLSFISDFQKGIQIESITGGLAAVDGPDLPVSPVPAPKSMLLLGLGMFCYILCRFFSKKPS